MKNKINIRKITLTGIFIAILSYRLFIFISGIRFKVCTDTASDEYHGCSIFRSMVYISSSVYYKYSS